MHLREIIVVATFGLLVACGYSTPHPSDAELRDMFESQRDEFARLEEMFEKYPQLLAIGSKWGTIAEGEGERKVRADSAWNYDESPLREFGAELDSLGITWGLQHCRQTPNQWMLFVNCYGLHPNSTLKGYIWSSDPLEPLRGSLDEDPAVNLDKYDRAYVRLDDRWYLLFEVWPGSEDRCLPRDQD